jgi:hypothetical protein
VPRSRPALLAGIAGPAAFVGAWVVGGLLKDGYSPVSDTISRLAERHASTRPLMTAGFVGFGVLMTWYAREAGRALGSPAVAAAVATSAVGTLAVAAFPVTAQGGTGSDSAHYVAAGVAYVADALAPLLAARHLADPRARAASYAAGAAVAAALVASLRADEVTGLLQRTGLTLYDAWAVALAVGLLASDRARTAR